MSEYSSASRFSHENTQDKLGLNRDPTEYGGQNMEDDFLPEKTYLKSQVSNSGLTLYDHLLSVLKRLLTERSSTGVDVLEHISKESKEIKDPTTFANSIDRSTETALAKIQKKLFESANGEEDEMIPEEGVDIPFPNLMKTAFFFEQASVGISREESYRLLLSLKQLTEQQPLQSVRFWGKIFGVEQNYYIAEAEYREGEEAEDEEEEEPEEEEEVTEKRSEEDDEEGEDVEDKPPASSWKPPPVVPREKNTGANKRVYFVCCEPGKPWTKLPPVTPQQIVAARSMRKFFTGRLDASISSHPPFPGTEANYLRAQIARISAGTVISPAGYFHFDEEEEEPDEEGGVKDNFVKNPEFEGLHLKELFNPSNWVHHVPHILPQGRCSWWNPVQKDDDEFQEDEEDEEGKEEVNAPVPEVGPPILTPLHEDNDLGVMPAWSFSVSSRYFPDQAVAVVSSNLWPGAFAFAQKKSFENVYIGWGHKYCVDGHEPKLMPRPQIEYVDSETNTEVLDPTPEEEAALRAAQTQAAEEGEEMGMEEEEDN